VVLVDQFSASASEIFAAAMQDYERAIIIGSDHTYGKGTVQNFTELDRMVPKKPSEMKDLGSLKMTVQKFYRINGDATQEKGVVPDIVLPDYYNYMEFGEKDLDYALPWDEISAVNWEPWTFSFDKKYIVDISNKRIAENEMLQLVDENGQRLQQIREKTNMTLKYGDYASLMKQREEAAEKFELIGKESFDINVNVLSADIPAMEADTSRKTRTDAWLTELQKDVYLLEAFNVLKDITDYQVKHAVKDGNR
jgi:carboxyl-terminal processing protease